MVLLSNTIWRELPRFPQHANLDAPVFPSRSGGCQLHPSMVERIVKKAAQRAGVEGNVSPTGCATVTRRTHSGKARLSNLVQATLGHASVATTWRYLHARPTDSSSKYLAI